VCSSVRVRVCFSFPFVVFDCLSTCSSSAGSVAVVLAVMAAPLSFVMYHEGEPMQTLEISPFETSAGDILVLDRPASSPWMWESWAASPTVGGKSTASAGGISKVEFGPATRGPFPLYACYDATITTASGAMVICGRYPALSCQLSLDSGMTWSMTTIDISGTSAPLPPLHSFSLYKTEASSWRQGYGHKGRCLSWSRMLCCLRTVAAALGPVARLGTLAIRRCE
jgi:hypothetical protein